MQTIVLAGGLGTRLRSVVPDLPKSLAPVAGRPFLAIVLEALERQGFDSIVLSVGYRSDAIRAAFGDRWGGLSLRYAVETEPLGTGGAIRFAARHCAAGDVFVLNGDSFVDLDYRAMREAHYASGAPLTICTVAMADTGRYGAVRVVDGRVAGFAEKATGGPGQINAGVYLMHSDLLETLGLPDTFSFERDVLGLHLDTLRPLAFTTTGAFIDIGVPDDFARAQAMFARS